VLQEFSPDHGWRSKLVSGLDCPFCVGTWVGFAAIGSYLIARRRPAPLAVWRFLAAGLGMNYMVGHVCSRIDCRGGVPAGVRTGPRRRRLHGVVPHPAPG